MSKTAIIFFVTIFCINAFAGFKTPPRQVTYNTYPLLNAYAANTGRVTLHRANSGYKVQVDVNYENYYSDDSDSDYSPSTIDMTVALYTNETVFTAGCLYFEYFYCDKYSGSCVDYQNVTSSITLPFFEGSGYPVNVKTYLDYHSWTVTLNSTIVTSCDSNYTLYGDGTQGIIGLGLSDNPGVVNSKILSIYLNPNGKDGLLMFSNNTNYANNLATIVPADSNWHVIGVADITLSSSGNPY